jgi:hypothetical protein
MKRLTSRIACVVAVLSCVVPGAAFATPMFCAPVEPVAAAKMPCHEPPARDADPRGGCAEILGAGTCCCLGDAPAGIPERPALSMVSEVQTCSVSAPASLGVVRGAEIRQSGFVKRAGIEPVGAPLFIFYHALLI